MGASPLAWQGLAAQPRGRDHSFPRGDRLMINKRASLVLSLCMLWAVAGCRLPGKVVSTEASTVCPTCSTETKTLPIKGLTYEKHICPECKVTTIWGEEDDSGISYVEEVVHVCTQCEAVVATCPQCEPD